jgi:hypothetical protein
MTARTLAGTFLLSLASSLLVALLIERLRASGKLAPQPSGTLPQPVAPGADHV